MILKKTFFYLLLVSIVLTTSCSSDDSSASQEDLIIGKWTISNVALVSMNMGGIDVIALMESSGVDTQNLGIEEMIENELGENPIFEFKADNTLTITANGEVDQGTYQLEGDQLTITTQGDPEPDTSTVKTLTANTLILTDGFEGIDMSGSDILPDLFTSQPWNGAVDLSFNRVP